MTIDPRKVQSLFEILTQLAPEQREHVLAQECGDDSELRKLVEDLLQRHDAQQDAAQQGAAPALADENLELTRDSKPVLEETVDSDVAVGSNATTNYLPGTAPGNALNERFTLLEKIGEGGMGEVWVAKQSSPFRRKVALKLIKPGMDSRAVIARFDQERQALAMMNHPNIARVLDGGITANGQPYFVMELVDGLPLTKFADEAKLTTEQRLKLFIPICNAVQHAHQKGLIHRDLKPANILVASVDGIPVPKIIDFGVAKATGGALTDANVETQFGAVIGTLEYMSPEQAGVGGMDIDTRADIYSLGVVLYELMTGLKPIDRKRLCDAGMAEMIRVIKEDEPSKPSTRLSTNEALPSLAAVRQIEPRKLTALLKGELDWVVMKCLEKSRDRRYETANGLARDIQRFLSGETVEARPASASYRFSKFVRRNRGIVLAASLLLVSLTAGLGGTLYGMLQAQDATTKERIAKNDALDEKQIAEREKARADKERSRAELREQEAITAVSRFGEVVANHPELRNSPQLEQLRKTLLAEPLTFFRSLQDSLQNDQDSRPESLQRLGYVAFNLGNLSSAIGDKQTAIQAHLNASEIFDQLVAENPNDPETFSHLAENLGNIGLLWRETGEADQAAAAYAKSLDAWKQLVAEFPEDVRFQNSQAGILGNTAVLFRERGKPAEAREALEDALNIRKRLNELSPEDVQIGANLANDLMNLGLLLAGEDSLDEAIEAFNSARQLLAKIVKDHPENVEFKSTLSNTLINLGRYQSEIGRRSASIGNYEQATSILEELTTEHPTNTDFLDSLAIAYNNMAVQHSRAGEIEKALVANLKAQDIRQKLVRANPTDIDFRSALANSYTNNGISLKQLGRFDDALDAFASAHELLTQLAAENPTVHSFHHTLGALLNNMATLKIENDQLSEARDDLQEAIRLQKLALIGNPNHPTYRRFLEIHYNNLALVAEETGDSSLLEKAKNGLDELAVSDPKFAALDQRMGEVLEDGSAHQATESIAFAERCYDLGKHTLAMHWYRDAFELAPELLDDRGAQHAYNAACSAALAISTDESDDLPIDDKRRQELRSQALSWLRMELQQWADYSKDATSEQRLEVVNTLKHWQRDSDLQAIRDESNLDQFPASERIEWESFWQSVEEWIVRNGG